MVAVNTTPLPVIPCPSCGANILDAGFHNTCTENVKVREDNFTYTQYGRLYLNHNTKGRETVEHESDFEVWRDKRRKRLVSPSGMVETPRLQAKQDMV
jgi:hypothetical protein